MNLFSALSFVALLSFDLLVHAETQKIGLLYPVTGFNATVGADQIGGAEIAVQEINQAGGILGKPIKLLALDSKSHRAKIRPEFQKLSEQNIQALFGGSSFNLINTMGKFATQQKIPYFAIQTYDSAINKKNNGVYVFRESVDSLILIRALAKHLKPTIKPNDKFFLVHTDGKWGKKNRVQFDSSFNVKKKNIVGNETLKWRAKVPKIQALVEKVIANPPNYIFLNLFGDDLIQTLNLLHQKGNKAVVVCPSLLDRHAEQVDPGGLKRVVAANSWNHRVGDLYKFERTQKFVEKFKKLYKKTPSLSAANTYTAIYAYKSAVEKAKSWEEAKVRKAILEIKHQVLKDEQKYTNDHVTHQSVFIMKGQADSTELLPIAFLQPDKL